MLNAGNNLVNVETDVVFPVMVTHIDKGEIGGLAIRVGVPNRR